MVILIKWCLLQHLMSIQWGLLIRQIVLIEHSSKGIMLVLHSWQLGIIFIRMEMLLIQKEEPHILIFIILKKSNRFNNGLCMILSS